MQRWVFKQARKRGWTGYEPSVLGTLGSDKALEEAKQYLLDLGASYKDAHYWFSGTCPQCGVWSGEWQEYSTTKMQCPECNHLQDVESLTMNREKRKSH